MGTNLSREERDVETSQSQHELLLGGSMLLSSTADTASSNADAKSYDPLLTDKTGLDSYSQEVYRLEWFSVLVVILLLYICEFVLFSLIADAHPDSSPYSFLGLIFAVVTACGLIGSCVTFYTGFFVFLTEYHNAVGKFLNRFLFLPRRTQQKCLRVVAFSYGVLWITGTGFMGIIIIFGLYS